MNTNSLSFKLLLILLFFYEIVYAETNNPLNINTLLTDIKRKTDLSEKTKLENSGIYVIYTRDDIERMQARYLKDILKSNAIFGYTENRLSIPDPLQRGTALPFASSSIRVYIDNQEMQGGMSGSGLLVFGDIDIGFVDHIEIYTHEPTYEYTTEPTMILIKLYSKSTLKDEGTKVEFNIGSFGNTRLSSYASHELNDEWSYFSYISLNDDIREKYNSYNTELSRDKKVAHIFTSIKSENHKILLDGIIKKKDGFIGPSLDATPSYLKEEHKSFHIGYDTSIKNFSFLATYDYFLAKGDFKDDITPIVTPPYYGMFPIASKKVNSISHIITTEAKYKFMTSKNTLTTGLKYRNKKYKILKADINAISKAMKNYTNQEVTTLFTENVYALEDNLLLICGLKYVNVRNKDSQLYKNDNQFMYRLGITYLSQNWIFKTIGAHNISYLEPYLLSGNYIVPQKLKNSYTNTLYEDIIYEKQNNKYELILGVTENEQVLLPDSSQGGRLNNYDKEMLQIGALFRWIYSYNGYDKLFSEFSYQYINNVPEIGNYEIYKIVLRDLIVYKKFDIVNEIIYDRDNYQYKHYFDYTAGVKYRYSRDFTISLKAENIFNKAKTTSYYRMSPTTFTLDSPLDISPIDRKATISLEYLF